MDIAVFAEDELLLIRRGGHPNIGMFALPGGFVELREDRETAAARELMPERYAKNGVSFNSSFPLTDSFCFATLLAERVVDVLLSGPFWVVTVSSALFFLFA